MLASLAETLQTLGREISARSTLMTVGERIGAILPARVARRPHAALAATRDGCSAVWVAFASAIADAVLMRCRGPEDNPEDADPSGRTPLGWPPLPVLAIAPNHCTCDSARRVQLRILLLSDFYAPAIGGMERHVQALARELVHRGHHVAVATTGQPGAPRLEVDEEGVRVHRLVGLGRLLTPFYEDPGRPFPVTMPDPGLMLELRRVVRAEQPEIVNPQGWIAYSALALPSLAHTAMVVTLHDMGSSARKEPWYTGSKPAAGQGWRSACVVPAPPWAQFKP